MTREVGQHAQHHGNRGRYARRQTVESVGEVGAVRHGGHHEDGYGDVEEPRPPFVAAHQRAVVQLVVLQEGDGGLGGLDRLRAQDDPLRDAHLSPAVRIQVDRFDGSGHLLAHHDILREPHREPDDDAETHLPDDLEAPLESLLVVAENLDIVVQTADEAEPEGRHQHQQHVDVVQPAEEEHGHQHGQQDNDAAHRGGAAFLELAFETEIANLLADLLALQETDDRLAAVDDDQQRHDEGSHGTERNVLEHARTGEVVVLIEVLENGVKHGNIQSEI